MHVQNLNYFLKKPGTFEGRRNLVEFCVGALVDLDKKNLDGEIIELLREVCMRNHKEILAMKYHYSIEVGNCLLTNHCITLYLFSLYRSEEMGLVHRLSSS